MWQKIKQKLKEVQNSDEATKNRWLVGASAVSMLIVIALWLIYLKFMANSGGQNVEPEKTAGFWQIFKNGLVIISQSVKDFVSDLISELSTGKTIIIE